MGVNKDVIFSERLHLTSYLQIPSISPIIIKREYQSPPIKKFDKAATIIASQLSVVMSIFLIFINL